MGRPSTSMPSKIGIYDILGEADHRDNDGHKLYAVKCRECGWEGDMRKNDINPKRACKHVNLGGAYIRRNERVWGNERLSGIFRGIRRRCYNQKDKNYRWYGAKGIRVCKEWLNNPIEFERWAIANGYSDSLTIDRIDATKDYCPENCRWVSLEDNARYKSTTRIIEVEGMAMSGREWAKTLGLSPNRINEFVRKYGLEETVRFIKKYMKEPELKPTHNQSLFETYMS